MTGASPPSPAGALLALDWGSTQLRAYLLDAGGTIVAERRSDAGASRLPRDGFEPALRALAGDWLGAGMPVLACGMVGSAHGWREAPYVPCPADASQLAAALVAVDCGGRPVHIVPGLCVDDALAPDVLRGEETQVLGLLRARPDLAPDATVVLPGTHSKWVRVRDGRIERFSTRMTGELYALLREHSVLARLMPASDDAGADAGPRGAGGESGSGADLVEAFVRGVDAAARGGCADLAGALFGVRALGLRGGLAPRAQPEYLSGLLIGSEIAAGLGRARAGLQGGPGEPGRRLVLCGETALCERYARAFARFGVQAESVEGSLVAAGLWWLASHAGVRGA